VAGGAPRRTAAWLPNPSPNPNPSPDPDPSPNPNPNQVRRAVPPPADPGDFALDDSTLAVALPVATATGGAPPPWDEARGGGGGGGGGSEARLRALAARLLEGANAPRRYVLLATHFPGRTARECFERCVALGISRPTDRSTAAAPAAAAATAAAATAATEAAAAAAAAASAAAGPSAPPPKVRSKRKLRCGECVACLAAECGTCTACRSMVRFGGEGKARKMCVRRKCLRPLPPLDARLAQGRGEPCPPHPSDDDTTSGEYTSRADYTTTLWGHPVRAGAVESQQEGRRRKAREARCNPVCSRLQPRAC